MSIRGHYILLVCIAIALLIGGSLGTYWGIQEVQGLVREVFAFDGLVEDLLVLRGLTFEYDLHPSGRLKNQWIVKYEQVSSVLDDTPGIPYEIREALVNLGRLFERSSARHLTPAGPSRLAADRLHDQIVSSLNTELSRIIDWLKEYSSASRNRLLGRVKEYSLTAVAILAFLAVLTGWILLSTERRMVSAISALRNGTEAVRSGNLDHRIILKGKDEFSTVAFAFNSMTEELGQQAARDAHFAQSQKLEAMGTLAGGIAHDFNNLLGGINGFTEMALLKLPPNSEARRDLLDVIRATRRAADLVHQILAFCRAGAEKPQPVRIRSVIAEALRHLRASIPATVEIRSNLEADPLVMADPGEIHRIIVNLCTNAYLAMKDRGGLLEVSLWEKDLEGGSPSDIAGVGPGRYLCLVVSDTGTGMSREVRDRIFEPFFTTRATGEGTGMGLSVVHGIVKERGGSIEVKSQPGMGTTFTVLLPVAKEASMGEVSPAVPTMGAGSILVVDDDLLATTLLERQLTGLGYRVKAFTGSPAALAAFGQDPAEYDLVVTGLTMHGLTGDVLAFRMREIRPGIPILLVSALLESATPEKAGALGVDAVLPKPYSMIDLSRIIHRLLSKG